MTEEIKSKMYTGTNEHDGVEAVRTGPGDKGEEVLTPGVVKIEDAMGRNRAERRRLGRMNGVKIPGTMLPYHLQPKNLKRDA